MATDVYKYRVYCDTDSKYEYVWAESEPTTCPANPVSHTIDQDKTVVVEVREDSQIKIKEEDTPTGAHYQARSFEIDVPAQTGSFSLDFSFPFPITLFSAEWINLSCSEGDVAQFQVAPDTVVGTLTSDMLSGSTAFTGSQASYAEVGYYFELTDGTNTADMGRVVSVDDDVVTCEYGSEYNFSASSPTYTKRTVKMVPHVYLQSQGRVQLGESKIGGSYIPANTNLRVVYQNNCGMAKTFSFLMEYLY
jgi:hypothetical protein